MEDATVPGRPIEVVLAAHTDAWMRIPGVVGTGIGACEGAPCIRVFVAGPFAEAETRVPTRIEGHRVELVVSGEFRPRGPPGL
jgi:hypothetical protein